LHPSPNIWRSSVIGCVLKYELSKKSVKKKGHNIRFQTIKTGKKQKERLLDIIGVEMGIVSKKVVVKFGLRNFIRPPKLGAKSLPMRRLIAIFLFLLITSL